MKRRDMILGAAAGTLAAASAAQTAAAAESGARQYLELRRYSLATGEKRQRFLDYCRDSLIPAYNRLGVNPVGAFSPLYGQNTPSYSLYLLLPFASLEAFAGQSEALLADKEYRDKAAAILDLPLSDPAFLRYESTLMLAFEDMPRLEAPAATAGKASRILEMRTYESHSLKMAKKKIEMFNQGGEIAIFRAVGLNPVFYAETLAGAQMPCLTYMLSHENMAARDSGWAAFGAHPDWLRLRADEQYKDTVSNITDIILKPLDFSQV